MHSTADIKAETPISIDRRSTGTVSGVVNMSMFGSTVIWVQKSAFSGKNSKQVLRIRYADASNVTYASATNFATPIIASGPTGSAAAMIGPFILDAKYAGKFARLLLSNVTASANTGVISVGLDNEVIPPASTGFTSVTGIARAPYIA